MQSGSGLSSTLSGLLHDTADLAPACNANRTTGRQRRIATRCADVSRDDADAVNVVVVPNQRGSPNTWMR